MERLTFKEERHSRNDQKKSLCFRRLCKVAGGDGQGKGGGEVLTGPSQQRSSGIATKDAVIGAGSAGIERGGLAVEERSVSEARGRKVRARKRESEGVRARERECESE